MNTTERIGSHVRESEMRDTKLCMNYCRMNDIQSTRSFYTWKNKNQGSSRVFSKLDRIMANQSWQNLFNTAEVSFQCEGECDHSLQLGLFVLRSERVGILSSIIECGDWHHNLQKW